MASRYDYRDPGTDPAYCDGLDWRNDVTRDSDPLDQAAAGIDAPDFDAPDPPIDPAEHATHALIDAMGTLRAEVLKADTVARAHILKGMIKRQYDQMNALDLLASAKIDDLVERRL